MSNGVNKITLFDGVFTSFAEVPTDTINVSSHHHKLQIFVAPRAVNLTVRPQVLDPNGVWRAFDQSYPVNDGECALFLFDGNIGKVRMAMSPDGASGACIVWAEACG